MEIWLAVLCGYLLDLLFGDPHWLLHPVQVMGWCISGGERIPAQNPPQNTGGRALGRCVAGCGDNDTLLFCASGDFIRRGFGTPSPAVWADSAVLLSDPSDKEPADREHEGVWAAEKR